MRITKIEGTSVAVSLASAEEAKRALKELRHKRRALKFLRGRCCASKKLHALRGSVVSGRNFVCLLMGARRWLFAALTDLATLSHSERQARPVEIERELKRETQQRDPA
jgi:hypothetical protein